MLLRIMVLYSCVSYAYAAIGMAIFGDARSDILEPRYGTSARETLRVILSTALPALPAAVKEISSL